MARHRIIKHNDGSFIIADERGNPVYTTECLLFSTDDIAWASEACDYLNQEPIGLAKRIGSHRAKSTFGT